MHTPRVVGSHAVNECFHLMASECVSDSSQAWAPKPESLNQKERKFQGFRLAV